MSICDKRNVIKSFVCRTKVSSLISWGLLANSTYYYRMKTGKRGCKPSSVTVLQDGNVISNSSVVLAIRFILAEEFVCYGYNKITAELQSNEFIINPKKTYRLMKEHKLLCGTVIKTNMGKRHFVQWRVQKAERPMEQLCMDIKYIHIHGANKNALLLTVLDVYTRSIVGQVLWWRIRKENVIWLLNRIVQKHQVKNITLRNDNGSQFIAHALRDYLKEKEIAQEFIHVATPEENCFIEAYHSIVEREVLQPRHFENITTAIDTFDRWEEFYNNRRAHGSLNNISPKKQWNIWLTKMNKEIMPIIYPNALSTKSANEKYPNFSVKQVLSDKIFNEQKSITFETQNQINSQTVFENSSSF